MLHPDKIADASLRELAKLAFMDVVAAYEVLGDPEKRAAFDDMGGEEQVFMCVYVCLCVCMYMYMLLCEYVYVYM